MKQAEVKRCLERMTVLVDTREQDTELLHKRLDGLGCAWGRDTLPYGDYMAQTTDDAGTVIRTLGAVERKMGISELCSCFSAERDRFQREFERAKAAGARLWVLVEEATWEKMYNGQYRSRMTPESLTASVLDWCAKYRIIPVFCHAETTAKLIHDILYYELKVQLEGGTT